MSTDLPLPGRSSAEHALVRSASGLDAAPNHRGAELVALAERFNHGIFMGALGFIGVSTLTALAFLPLRASAVHGRPPTLTVAAGLVVLGLTMLATWRGRDLYQVLSRRPELQLVPVLIAAALT